VPFRRQSRHPRMRVPADADRRCLGHTTTVPCVDRFVYTCRMAVHGKAAEPPDSRPIGRAEVRSRATRAAAGLVPQPSPLRWGHCAREAAAVSSPCHEWGAVWVSGRGGGVPQPGVPVARPAPTDLRCVTAPGAIAAGAPADPDRRDTGIHPGGGGLAGSDRHEARPGRQEARVLQQPAPLPWLPAAPQQGRSTGRR
jgi:hypothetical protein